MTRPYFSVGEEVILVSEYYPEYNGEYIVEVIKGPNTFLCPYSGNKVFLDEVGYKLDGLTFNNESNWWAQNTLRKKPKLSDDEFDEISFSELMTNYRETA